MLYYNSLSHSNQRHFMGKLSDIVLTMNQLHSTLARNKEKKAK